MSKKIVQRPGETWVEWGKRVLLEMENLSSWKVRVVGSKKAPTSITLEIKRLRARNLFNLYGKKVAKVAKETGLSWHGANAVWKGMRK